MRKVDWLSGEECCKILDKIYYHKKDHAQISLSFTKFVSLFRYFLGQWTIYVVSCTGHRQHLLANVTCTLYILDLDLFYFPSVTVLTGSNSAAIVGPLAGLQKLTLSITFFTDGNELWF